MKLDSFFLKLTIWSGVVFFASLALTRFAWDAPTLTLFSLTSSILIVQKWLWEVFKKEATWKLNCNWFWGILLLTALAISFFLQPQFLLLKNVLLWGGAFYLFVFATQLTIKEKVRLTRALSLIWAAYALVYLSENYFNPGNALVVEWIININTLSVLCLIGLLSLPLWGRSKKTVKIALAIIFLFVLMRTQSFSALLGIFVGSIVIFQGKKYSKAALAGGTILLIGLIFIFRENLFSSLQSRYSWWQNAFTLFLMHPLEGAGYQAFDRFLPFIHWTAQKTLFAHSFPIELLSSWGIAVFITFFTFLILGLGSGNKFFLPLVLGLLVQSLTDYSLLIAGYFWIFAFYYGMMVKTRSIPIKSPVKKLSITAILVVAMFTIWGSIKCPLRAQLLFQQAQNAFNRMDFSTTQKKLEEACLQDPTSPLYPEKLGIFLQQTSQDHNQSLKWMQEALKRNPSNIPLTQHIHGLQPTHATEKR